MRRFAINKSHPGINLLIRERESSGDDDEPAALVEVGGLTHVVGTMASYLIDCD